jgi:SAM-dependent methyltransferase
MSFSASWLALREPADHAARDAVLLQAAGHAAGADPVILDLGSGTGSTLRAFAKVLPDGARWRLVDSDAALLDVAARSAGPDVALHRLDLRNLDQLPLAGAGLVTASALLDLCSADWVTRLARMLLAHDLPFYAALNYDGQMQWTPQDAQDAAVTAAFNAHQRGDKGFGPALGPDCATRAAAIFADLGFTVSEAESPWMIGPDQADLQAALNDGIAAAALETGLAQACDWGALRQTTASTGQTRIGHRDFLALPPAKT